MMSRIAYAVLALVIFSGLFTHQHALAYDQRTAAELRAEGTQLYQAGQYEQAARVFRNLVTAVEATHGQKSPEYAVALNDLGFLLHLAGRYEQAEPLFREAIKIDKATIGEGHPEYATG
ncbi:MAG: tetratricopeptide repeat protein, partial [Paracoccaceae bacterium]